ncbi:FHA domain-containing protein [Specibacter sp. RAF43]|uniref:FHA domain-containing protein n=1 Tax=Specibacter sp. RAF43 TaxID=3233057 RepID=UPI003F9DB1AE
MDSTTYRTGTWLGIVRSGAVVVLGPDTDPRIVAALWDFLADAPAMDGILNEVTRAFATELTEMPPFGILLHGDRLHAVLRGEMTLEVADGAETTVVSGQNVTTWSEKSMPPPDGYALALGAPDDAEAGLGAPGTFWPLGEAVVHCGEILYTRPGPQVGVVAAPCAADVPVPAGPEPLAPLPEPLPEPEMPADGESPEAIGDPADDDAYARFALAAEAEWRAQLDPESAIDLDADVDAPDDGAFEMDGSDGFDRVEPGDFAPEGMVVAGGEFGVLDTDVPEPEDRQPDDLERMDPEPDGSAPDDQGPEAAGHGIGAPAAGNIPPMPPTPPTVSAWTAGSDETPDAAPHETPDAAPHATPEAAPAATPEAAPAATAEPGRDQSPPPTGPVVVAQLCPQGHANPPGRPTCWHCGEAVAGELVEVVRPRVGRMHISNGGVIDLDRTLIIGRLPSVDRVEGAEMPRLVQVDSGGDISRSHAEIRVDGWQVLLIDLHATNGTVLIRPGEDPRRLAPGEQVVLKTDDRADLGDGVTLHFGEIL